MTSLLRLTWVQPEDLVGHELRQAEQDGRDATAVRDRWLAAGGRYAPPRAGASPDPPRPELRALAEELLDELAALSSPLAADEPTDWPSIVAACPQWPSPPRHGPDRHRAPAADPGPGARDSAPPAASAVRSAPAVAHGRPGDPAPAERLSSPAEPHSPQWEPDVHAHGTRLAAAGPEGRIPGASRPPDESLLHALHAAWLGRAVGCLLGKPVEKLPLQAIRAIGRATGNWPPTAYFTAKGLPAELAAAHPWNRRSAATSLAENIDGMPEDDDLNYPLLALVLLQRHGRAFTTAQVGALWLDELPAGRTFTAERIAYRNLLSGIEPPLTATHRNPFREWIGASIRADLHGWTNPGDPAAAAEQAYRDAVLTHTANGVYSAMFTAGAIATAAGGTTDVHEAIATGLTVVPTGSRLARAVRFGVEAARSEADFDRAVDRVHAAYGAYHWVHALPNAALLAAALTHADGDFTGTVCRAVSGGLDTDSGGATAGSLAGLLAGHPGRLPDHWTAPLKNRLSTSVAGFDGAGFDTLARLTLKEALRP
ncbi:ADP-ribosylglycohydrolase family protein [Streptomyces sp. ISL-10]|uniref:ADP-ribosylglycohydrolase family protein n=1 Tax=Streptomyces sp. ISL-10 TaxID=2819172 RepID=UPI001BE8F211|nr:ADP-ribosylglycohydrolase family protein [Streptomyces sp. ISL-10]MBT2366612.1 ADP-ribosylglycohydrolase family protein [Streptomyces sp. ISL-10]